jgi:hypothetical protein
MIGDPGRPWFGRRGNGSRNLPISWQGWVATILYASGISLCFFTPAFLGLAHAELIAFAAFAAMTIPFAFLCARKSR